MDQLNKFIAVLKKHYFWFATALTLLLCMAAWWLSTSKLQVQAGQDQNKLKGVFTGLANIQQTQAHPNDNFIQVIGKAKESVERSAMAAHQTFYEKQTEIFGVPDGVTPTLRKELDEMLTKYRSGDPFGKQEVRRPLPNIPQTTRYLFVNEVEGLFKQLFETVELREPVKTGSDSSADSPMPAGLGLSRRTEDGERVWSGMVVWSGEDRERIVKRYTWNETPTESQVWFALEDYNVYRELLKVIKDANADARDHLAAAVKQIMELRIGQDVGAGEGSRRGSAGSIVSAISDGNDDTKSGANRGGRQDVKDDPFDERYVDANGVFLSGGDKHPFPAFRLIPFRLEVLADQRQLPKLLSTFANARMPIEIMQVSFNPGDYFNPLGGGGRQRGSASTSSGWGSGASSGVERTFHDTRVELIGVMYLYEKPDPKKLEELGLVKKEPEANDPSVQPTTPSTPSETPPATTPPEGTTEAAPADGAPADGAPADGAPAEAATPAVATPEAAGAPADAGGGNGG